MNYIGNSIEFVEVVIKPTDIEIGWDVIKKTIQEHSNVLVNKHIETVNQLNNGMLIDNVLVLIPLRYSKIYVKDKNEKTFFINSSINMMKHPISFHFKNEEEGGKGAGASSHHFIPGVSDHLHFILNGGGGRVDGSASCVINI